ncbi:ankyrin repeat domain-containing protein 50 [Microdochium nivale]|nr:ankyrin repeat domain-containing protein 50 [Microdochium nivale]
MAADTVSSSHVAATLVTLPPELVLHIARHLSTWDTLALGRACRHLDAATDFAYKRHIRYSPKSSLPLGWAVKENNVALARRALVAGADPNELVGFVPGARPTFVDLPVVPLFVAVNLDDLPMTELLLEYGADPSAISKSGERPLTMAARRGRIDICQILLNTAAGRTKSGEQAARIPWFVDARDRNGESALHVAAAMGWVEICNVLLAHGAKLEARNQSGLTPLHRAVGESRLATVVSLLKAGADPMLFDSSEAPHFSKNVLDMAVSVTAEVSLDAQLEVLRVIVSRIQREAPGGRKWMPIDDQQAFRLLTTSHFFLARVLLKGGIPVNVHHRISGHTPLIAATTIHNDDTFKLRQVRGLIDAGADVNAASSRHGTTALMSAAESGSQLVVELLLTHGASLSATNDLGMSVLHHAVKSRDHDTVQLLLDRIHDAHCGTGPSSDHKPKRALPSTSHDSKMADHGYCPAVVEALSLRTRDDGETPLMTALWSGATEIAQLLLSSGADMNAVDSHGRSIFATAVSSDRVEIARYLLDQGGVDLEQRDKRGMTPLMHAGSTTTQLLIEHGADVNAVSEVTLADGTTVVETPFTLAVRSNNMGIAKMLVRAGVDVAAQLELDPSLMASVGGKPKMTLFLEHGWYSDSDAGHEAEFDEYDDGYSNDL